MKAFLSPAWWLASGLLTITPIALAQNEAEYAKRRAAEEEQMIRTPRTGEAPIRHFPSQSISILLREARESLRSSDRQDREAAAEFLDGSWITRQQTLEQDPKE